MLPAGPAFSWDDGCYHKILLSYPHTLLLLDLNVGTSIIYTNLCRKIRMLDICTEKGMIELNQGDDFFFLH